MPSIVLVVNFNTIVLGEKWTFQVEVDLLFLNLFFYSFFVYYQFRKILSLFIMDHFLIKVP